MNTIHEAISRLQNNQALILMDDPVHPDSMVGMPLTMEQLNQFTQSPDSIFVLGLVIRPGMTYFIRHLELVHFHPEEKTDNEFIMIHLKWNDLPFVMVSVPVEYDQAIKDSAKATQVTLVEGALPITVASEGIESMPISFSKVYSVESARFSVLHKLGTDAARQWEEQEIQKLEQQYL